MIFKSSFRRSISSIACVALVTLSACSLPFLQEKKAGTVLVSITVPGSASETDARFIHPDTKKIVVTVTGADMSAVTSNANISGSDKTSTVELTNITPGLNRTITASLRDSADTVLAEGSVVTDISEGSVTKAAITAKPVGATAMTPGNPVTIAAGSAGKTFMYSVAIPAAGDYLAIPVLDGTTRLIPSILNPDGSAMATGNVSGDIYTFRASAAGTYFAVLTVPATWTGAVTFTLALPRTITSFGFTTPLTTGSINEAAHTIAVTVPLSTNVTSLTPMITYYGASISPAIGTAQNFTNPVTYTVTGTDGTSQAYVVTVTRSTVSTWEAAMNAPDNAVIHGITFLGGKIYMTGYDSKTLYTLNPDGTVLNRKTYTQSLTGLTNDGTNLWYTDDSTHLIYNIQPDGTPVSPIPSIPTPNTADSTGLYYYNGTLYNTGFYGQINIVGKTGSIRNTFATPGNNNEGLVVVQDKVFVIDYGANVIQVLGINGAKAKEIPLPVTNALALGFDGKSLWLSGGADHKVYTYDLQLGNKTITSFGFDYAKAKLASFDDTSHSIGFDVPFGTDLTTLKPTIAHTGASISPDSGIACDFTNPVTYTVTAADGTTQQYTVSVKAGMMGNNVIKGVHLINMNQSNYMGYVFIDSAHKLYSQESSDIGVTWSEPEVIDNSGKTVDFVADIDGATRMVVLWVNSPTVDPLGTGGTAWYSNKTDFGSAWATPLDLVSSPQLICPSVFRPNANLLFTVGTDSTPSGTAGAETIGFHWTNSTTTYTPIDPILNTVTDTAAAQQVYGDSVGNLHFLYVHTNGSGGGDIYDISGGTTWAFPTPFTETTLVSCNTLSASQPSVMDFNSQEILMYTTSDGNLFYRYASTFTGLFSASATTVASSVALPDYSLSRTRTAYAVSDIPNTKILFVWQGTDGKIYWSKLNSVLSLTSPAVCATNLTLDGVSFCSSQLYISGHNAEMGRIIRVTP